VRGSIAAGAVPPGGFGGGDMGRQRCWLIPRGVGVEREIGGDRPATALGATSNATAVRTLAVTMRVVKMSSP
jgi:hypothetical protein